MRALVPVVALGLACGGPAGSAVAPDAIEPAMEAALLERDAAREELARIGGDPDTPLDLWRRWRARSRLERAVLDLDALQRRRLEARARAIREAEARSTALREEIDQALRRASRAMRRGDVAGADLLYRRAAGMLETGAAGRPAQVPVPDPAPPDPGVASGRALLAERVRLTRRLAQLTDQRARIAAGIAQLEEDRGRLVGLQRYRGVLDRGDPFPPESPGATIAARESPAARVLEARLTGLRAEAARLEEEAAGVRTAIGRIDAAVRTSTPAPAPSSP